MRLQWCHRLVVPLIVAWLTNAAASPSGTADGGATANTQKYMRGSVIALSEDGSIVVAHPESRLSPLVFGVKAVRIADATVRGDVLRVAVYDEAGWLVVVESGGRVVKVPGIAQAAHLSADQSKLVFEERINTFIGGTGILVSRTVLFDLASGKATYFPEIGASDWKDEGTLVGVRTTVTSPMNHPRDARVEVDRRTHRVQIDVRTGKTIDLGPGGVQILPPRGDGLAFVANEGRVIPFSENGDRCTLELVGGLRFPLEGRICLGKGTGRDVRLDSSGLGGAPRIVRSADQGIRWDGSGRWLAFGRYRREVPQGRRPDVLVVSADGKKKMELDGWARRPSRAPVVADWKPAKLGTPGGGLVWIDWNLSSTKLVVEDCEGEVLLYDLESRSITSLGPGAQPQWSPDGTRVLMLVAEGDTARDGGHQPGRRPDRWHALVFAPGEGAARDLGRVRDATWVPAGL